jgi:hypothetical protein
MLLVEFIKLMLELLGSRLAILISILVGKAIPRLFPSVVSL